ncbi:MAG: ABC transporter ATP-binding protein [Oscillospiraceae bacterium]|nr:ABC transporter ATP-binding protein [Oscillospiraceae bacterium]
MDKQAEVLKVSGLCKRFKLSAKQQKLERTKEKYKQAVKDVSFSAYKGEIFGLLGPNGAGKTTTMRILATLIRPDAGEAWIDGANILTQENQVRSKLAFLTGDLKLEQFFTPNYLFDFFSDLHGVDPQVREQRKEELFRRFGIDRYAQTKVAELSQGMRQKVSLVVSIVHDPHLIIFDEPTNGLDVITAKTVTDFLLELKEKGKTVIISTHIFNLIEKLCDRVGILINGRMVACDALENICDGRSLEDRFFALYEAAEGGKDA